jgi:hypothetical protein
MIAPASPSPTAVRRRAKPKRIAAPAASRSVPGVITPDALYTVEEAKARLRLGDWAWRGLRRRGLRVLRIAGRNYVLADDIIRFFAEHGAPTEEGEKT